MLIRDGHVPTPGIGVLTADEQASARLGIDGLVVMRVLPGSPAQRAGLRGVDLSDGTLGDVIVAVTTPVSTIGRTCPTRWKRLASVGPELTVLRDGTQPGFPWRSQIQKAGYPRCPPAPNDDAAPPYGVQP